MRTTSTLTLESVEQRLNEAVISLQHLVADVAKLRHAELPPEANNSQEELIAQLLAEGVIVKPSPEMVAIGAEWDAVPEEEKRALDETLRNLQLDLPVSEMIHKMRGGWYPDESKWGKPEE